jgi:hypothetical protein
MKVVERAN